MLHPGVYRRERYNDVNGAVYETTRFDAHGNAFTVNHQLGPAERYGYQYAGVSQAPVRVRPQPAVAAAVGTGGVAAADYSGLAGGHAQGGDSKGDSGAALLLGLIVVVALALGPVFLGVWMVRRAAASGRSRTHGRVVLLLEVPWLAFLCGRLYGGGTTAWATAFSTALGVVTWYGLTLREERRSRPDQTP